MGLNRFLLFAYEYFEPEGGWEDYIGSFASEAEARQAGEEIIEKEGGYPPLYIFHIVDLVPCKIVYTARRPTE